MVYWFQNSCVYLSKKLEKDCSSGGRVLSFIFPGRWGGGCKPGLSFRREIYAGKGVCATTGEFRFESQHFASFPSCLRACITLSIFWFVVFNIYIKIEFFFHFYRRSFYLAIVFPKTSKLNVCYTQYIQVSCNLFYEEDISNTFLVKLFEHERVRELSCQHFIMLHYATPRVQDL